MSSPESESESESGIKYDTVIDVRVMDNSHSQMIGAINFGSRVLDVGCASGVMGAYLHREMQCTVVGIDNDEKLLRIAKASNAYESLHHLDLEKAGALDEISENFDYVLLGDIVEHLRHPTLLIERLIPLVAVGGTFLISIPNVTHGSIKLGLLLNQFEYADEGILDRTHLRFFTAASAYDFVQNCGLEVTKFSRVFAPIYQQNRGEIFLKLPRAIRRYVESDTESWVFQYVISALPRVADGACGEDLYSKITPDESEIDRLRKLKFRWARQVVMSKLLAFREK
jgi:2-polyprenyl-3-methyl-5-hydroxy-6-metoxy-1,4-benzoquinol methylase